METSRTTAASSDLCDRILRAITYLRPAHTAGMLADKFNLREEEEAVREALKALAQRGLLRVSGFGPSWETDPGYGLTTLGHDYKVAKGL